MRVVHGG
jgi:hypothetical protein